MAKRRRTAGHTSNGRGNLLIERTFPAPIGLVRLSSGTKDAQALGDINKMLTAFAEGVPPRYDILESVKLGRVAPMYALSLWRQGRVADIPSADMLPGLNAEYEKWAKRLESSEAYRGQIASTFRQLGALGTEAKVGDLPALLAARRDQAQDAGTPVGFNRSKAHVQAFVRDTLGEDHALYRAVTRIATLAPGAEPERRAQQPAALALLLAPLPAVHQRMAWSLAVSGMRPKEYFGGDWNTQSDRIHVGKSKTDAGTRDVPRWIDGLPLAPERSRDAFEGMWDRRVGEALRIYDLRRSFKVWMEDAGVTRSRRKIYFGHAAGDVSDLYERRELDAWLQDDAKRLDCFAGDVVRQALSGMEVAA